MGDADLARGVNLVFQGNEIEEALEDLQDNVNAIQLNLNILEERTLNQLQEHMRDHMRAYFTFRCFVIAINFVFIPVLMAVGMSCIMKQLLDPNVQDALQGIIQILWIIAASLGASLYLGSIWAVYNLPPPERLLDEEPSEDSAMVDDFDFFEMLVRRPLPEIPDLDDTDDIEMIEIPENDGNEADNEVEEPDYEIEIIESDVEEADNEDEGAEDESGVEEGEAEEDENNSDKATDLLMNREHVQNDMNLQQGGSITMNLGAATEERDDTATKNDNEANIVFFRVDEEILTPEKAETVV